MIPQVKTILYTTALGSHTRPVFRFTVGLAKQLGARIILLHVVEPLSNSVRFLIDSYLKPDAAKDLHQQASAGMLEKIHQRMEAFCAEELGATLEQTEVIAEVRVASGLACEVILSEADRHNVDLIVMGTHTGSGMRTDLLGSTTRRITLTSKRPVLVVPVADSENTEWAKPLI
ncbi:MAG TPA: universal stress protein [Candidatus Competibacter phosphatis]|jgi:nucleotide-binding universal stress UspA family protein|nr:universal stress protein [Candidatus Competibacter phosphatis]